jgi:CMP-N-acetylneuraminic acid synthetase
MKRYIGIIPFRKNSKRLPNKNILELAGIPLYQHSELAAMASTKLSGIMLATDYAKSYVTPLKESTILHERKEVSDEQTSVELLVEIILKYNLNLQDNIVLLQPTCPLRTGIDIDKAIAIHQKEPLINLVSVYRVDNQIYNKYGCHLHDVVIPAYQRNSSIYIFNIKKLLETRVLFDKLMNFYIMPRYKSIDINDFDDFEEVQAVIEGGV